MQYSEPKVARVYPLCLPDAKAPMHIQLVKFEDNHLLLGLFLAWTEL